MRYFDHFADSPSTWVGDWITRKTNQCEFKLMRSCFDNKLMKILEIGPGTGEMARLLLREGYTNYTAVEPNQKMRERLIAVGISVKDYMIPNLKEQNAVYDVIILSDVFEHLNGTSEARIFLSEAQRVLRPGGWLCLVAPDYLHWREDFFNCDYTHSNITTVRRVMQLLYNHGFQITQYYYLSGFVAGRMATLLSTLVRVGLFFANGNGMDQKLYKLKLTFLRRFIIIGKRID